MAEWHLEELRTELERKGWQIICEHPSHHLYVSGSWEIQRNPSIAPIFIDFEGVDDLNTLPMNESYACYLRNYKSNGLYFSKRGEKRDSNRRVTWRGNLVNFVSQLDRYEKQADE